jgi:hypothetical protein
LTIEQEYDNIKRVLGSKLGEFRAMNGFPKREYSGGRKSSNLLFKIEGGENFPNSDTLEYFIELFDMSVEQAGVLREIHRIGKEKKSQIIRRKRGWD